MHAHELAFGTQGGVDLAALAGLVLEPYAGAAQVVAAGPAVTLAPTQVQALALVHELATNAVKHGALSVPEGRVRVGWEVGGGDEGVRWLRLRWEERAAGQAACHARLRHRSHRDRRHERARRPVPAV